METLIAAAHALYFAYLAAQDSAASAHWADCVAAGTASGTYPGLSISGLPNTLGAGQITYTYAYSEWKRFLGVSAFTQRGGHLYGAGTSQYLQQDSVSIITLGEVWVSNGGVSVLNGQRAYVIVTPGTTQGQFNSTVTAPNFDASLHWRTNNNAGRAVLGVRYGIAP